MLNVLLRNTAALISLFIFMLGNGFFATFIASELTHSHTSTFLIGLMSTSMYAGLVLGSFKIESLIARVSHIRTYAAFASMIAVIALMHGIFTNIYVWLVLRFFTGVATAGVYIVVESWLLSQSTVKTRGQILSFYMVTFYAAQALGQLLLKLDSGNALMLFSIISICSSLSVMPLAMTKTKSPEYCEPSTLGIRSLYKNCASGLLGCLVGGLILGAVYGLFPVFLVKTFANTDVVARLMFAIIMGGMALQYPIGKLSDVIERRIVLLMIGLSSIAVVVAMLAFIQYPILFMVLCIAFGGLTFTIYPVSISHACDTLDTKDIVGGTQTLLLTYSIGAMLGPVIAPLLMKINQKGLFVYFILTLCVLVVFLSWRKTVKENTPQEESFITYPRNTPISCEVDPRGED